MKYEYQTTIGFCTNELNFWGSAALTVDHPKPPDGEGWTMCGSVAAYNCDNIGDLSDRIYWFWQRPIEEPIKS
jgi:hypothetical protein